MALNSLIKPEEVINGGIFRPAPLNERFPTTLISPHIKSAERRWLLPILCRDLYDAMIAAQNPDPSNYNPELPGGVINKFPNDPNFEALWVSLLLEMEGFAVYHQALPFIVLQLGANGLYLNESVFAQTAGQQGLKYLKTYTMDTLTRLQSDLGNYLCENKADFDSSFCFQKKCNDCEICNSCSCNCEGEKKYKRGLRKSAGIIFYNTPRRRHYDDCDDCYH